MKTILDVIGHTPLVKLQHLCPNPLVNILVKVEYLNPSGSVKDRIVRYIIDKAEKEGLLKPGGTVIESTSGNTGAAIAMICAIRGYKALLTMPDKVSKEKQDALKAFGAEIIVTPTSADPHSPDHYIRTAERLGKEIPNSYRIDQYDNPENPRAHYETTGPEIWQQTEGKIDYFVASGSTGGTISGAGRFLKEKNPNLKIIMPDPVGSIYYSYFKTGKIPEDGNCNYQVEGIGEDHLVEAMDFSVVDDMMQVTDKEAFLMARQLAKKEGLLAGGSSGVNVWAAIEIAKKLTQPATIVTVLCDGGIKYLSKIYNDDWMRSNNYL